MFEKSIFKDFESNNYIFLGAFNLGIPLVINHIEKFNGWEDIRQELTRLIYNAKTDLEILATDFEPENNFPIGRPLIIKHSHFSKIFDFHNFLENSGLEIERSDYSIDHRIWICPSGIVLIIGKISFESLNNFSYARFSDIIEEHYAELSYLFSEVAKIIIYFLPKKALESSLCFRNDLQKLMNVKTYLNEIDSRKVDKTIECSQIILKLQNDYDFRLLLESILIDVYYIKFIKLDYHDKINISYIDTIVESSDSLYLLMITIAYSSFIGFLKLQEQLNEQARFLSDSIVELLPYHNEIRNLKLFRIYCLQFIQESRPICIRLKHSYMVSIENFWEQERLHLIVEQINEQLKTLDEMFEWVDSEKKEKRNTKIGIAAVFLSIISITAVVAQLITTIDIKSPPFLSMLDRIFLILCGFFAGGLSIILIYVFPLSRKKRKLKKLLRRHR